MTLEKFVLRKIFPILAIIFLLGSLSEASQNHYLQIVATPALAVRDIPGVNGRVLARKYRGDRLTVYSSLDHTSVVNGITGYWVEVDDGFISRSELSGGRRGWVFSGFLIDYKEGPEYLYNKALTLEKKDPQKAIHTYRHIIKEYPKARELLAEDCFGVYSDYADNRIKILSCKKKEIPALTYRALEKELVRSILENDYSFLTRISGCQVSLDNGRLLWGVAPQNLPRYIRFSDIDTTTMSTSPSSIFFSSKTKPYKYYFLFDKNGNHYRLMALGRDR